MKTLPAALLCLVFATGARAQDVILMDQGPPPAREATDAEVKRQADGDWVRGILAGAEKMQEPGAAPPRQSGCEPLADRKPHGVVWAEVGTGGYAGVGAVVSQPVGECGFVTLGVSKTDQGRARPGRRR